MKQLKMWNFIQAKTSLKRAKRPELKRFDGVDDNVENNVKHVNKMKEDLPLHVHRNLMTRFLLIISVGELFPTYPITNLYSFAGSFGFFDFLKLFLPEPDTEIYARIIASNFKSF